MKTRLGKISIPFSIISFMKPSKNQIKKSKPVHLYIILIYEDIYFVSMFFFNLIFFSIFYNSCLVFELLLNVIFKYFNIRNLEE